MEDKKPYVYTMPESFMYDQSVPARWRLLGIINGFHINGLEFFATNEWVMKELDCSQQTVSTAIKELEKMGEIKIKRQGMNRIISRIFKSKGTNQLVGGYKSTCMEGTNQLVHNADIYNSDNIIQQTPLAIARPDEESKKDLIINKSSKFIEPTFEEVFEYCRERRNSVDANSFIDFYTSKGWKVGNQKMKDWKAAVRTWEKRNSQSSNKNVYREQGKSYKDPNMLTFEV